MLHTGLYLYEKYIRGDESALLELVRTYSDSLTRYAYCYLKDSSLAEDIMEDTFAVLITKRKHFHTAEHFHGYLYRIARNKSIDYLRKHARLTPLEDVQELLAHENTEQEALKKERDQKIYICMQQLPEQYKEVLYLIYFEEFSIDELCRILKKNTKQIYNQHSRAKLALKELLIKEGITHEDL